jgi:hypothetical protein
MLELEYFSSEIEINSVKTDEHLTPDVTFDVPIWNTADVH